MAGGSIFSTGAPAVGLDESTRRSLAQLNMDHLEVRRVVAACKKLGLKVAAPIVQKPNAVAHIGIPDKKVAIVIRKTVESSFREEHYNKWKDKGWELMIVTHRQTQMVTDDQLAEQLHIALQSLGKVK